jgi:RNA polymerase sigma factor (sigma-70 family)
VKNADGLQQSEAIKRVESVQVKRGSATGEVWPIDGHDDLYLAHFPALMRVAYCLTGSNEVAEDLVQDTFMRCASRLGGLRDPASYLRAALVNACNSHHRRNRVASRVGSIRADDVVELPAAVSELREALLVLPMKQRTAIVLRYLVDLDDGEIARIIGCRPATVRSLVHRGLARLREELS